MTNLSTAKFSITVGQGPGTGSPWIVKVHRKMFFGKRRVSSDWFLSQEQAEQFGRDIVKSLQRDGNLVELKTRHPGWTLRRAIP